MNFDMFEPKIKKSKGKEEKLPYQVFMAIVFFACMLIQLLLIKGISLSYNISTSNTFLACCAIWIVGSCLVAGLYCLGDYLYAHNKKTGLVLIIFPTVVSAVAIVPMSRTENLFTRCDSTRF